MQTCVSHKKWYQNVSLAEKFVTKNVLTINCVVYVRTNMGKKKMVLTKNNKNSHKSQKKPNLIMCHDFLKNIPSPISPT